MRSTTAAMVLWVIGSLGFVGGIVFGGTIIVEHNTFNTTLMFYTWGGTALLMFGLLLGQSILANLENLNTTNLEILDELKRKNKSEKVETDIATEETLPEI